MRDSHGYTYGIFFIGAGAQASEHQREVSAGTEQASTNHWRVIAANCVL